MSDTSILWNNYVTARNALFGEKRIRSYRSPTTDFAEWIVSKILGGELCVKRNNPGFDVYVKEGNKRIQVKSIAKHSTNKNGKTLNKKDFANKEANYYAFVYFDDLQPSEFFLIETCRLIEVCNTKAKIARNDLTTDKTAKKYTINLEKL